MAERDIYSQVVEHGVKYADVEMQDIRYPLLPLNLRPSFLTVVSLLPNPDIYSRAYLPYHGPTHGEETMMIYSVLVNIAYEDVKTRKAHAFADAFRQRIDERTGLIASGLHDCGRVLDWHYLNDEMQEHGHRGARQLRTYINSVGLDNARLTLSGEKITNTDEAEHLLYLVDRHILTTEEKKEKRADRRQFEDYDPKELNLRLLQEADHLGLARGFYTRTPESSHRVPIAAALNAGGVFLKRPLIVERGLRFPQAVGLYKKIHALTEMTRRDAQIETDFAHEQIPYRSGAALAAGLRLGFLKP